MTLQIQSQGRGELLVSLCWQPVTSRLTVVVLKARNLPKMDVTGLADPYVKIYLLYDQQRIAKKKTHVKKRTLSPVFNESFVFDIPNGADGLNNVSLEFMLLDWDRVTKNEVSFSVENSLRKLAFDRSTIDDRDETAVNIVRLCRRLTRPTVVSGQSRSSRTNRFTTPT